MIERALMTIIICTCVVVLAVKLVPFRMFQTSAERLGIIERPHYALADEIDMETRIRHAEAITLFEERLRAKTWKFLAYCCLVLSVVTSIGFLMWVRKHDQERSAKKEVPDSTSHSVFDKRQKIYRILSNDLNHLLDGRIAASDIMSTRLISVEPNTPTEVVVAKMKKHRIHHIFVCKNERLKGVISTDDLAEKTGRIASDLMNVPQHKAQKDEDINQVITAIVEHRLPCLPVVEQGRLCGVITKSDLLVTLQSAIRVVREIGNAMSETIFDNDTDNGDEPKRISTDDFQKKLDLVPT